LVRIKMLLGDGSRRPSVPVVVAGDRLRSCSGFLEGTKRDHAVADRKTLREACVLDEHRPPRRQLADAAIAEPTALGLAVEPREPPELAPLVVLEAVGLDAPERASPGCDRGEAVEAAAGDGPFVEDDGRPSRTPFDPAGRDGTVLAADVRRDCEVDVVLVDLL